MYSFWRRDSALEDFLLSHSIFIISKIPKILHFYYASFRSFLLSAPFRYVSFTSVALSLSITHAKHYHRRKLEAVDTIYSFWHRDSALEDFLLSHSIFIISKIPKILHFYYASIGSFSLSAPFRYDFFTSVALSLSITPAKHYHKRKWREGGRKE